MASAIENEVTNGMLGVPTLTTAYGVLAAGTTATGPVQNIGTGTAGQALAGAGAGVLPAFTTILATQAQQETGTATDVYVSPGRQQYHPTSAKAHSNWGIVAGAPVIGTSLNVSSLTDTAVGQITVNFTTSFSDANYSVVFSGTFSSTTTLAMTLTTATTSTALISTNSTVTPFSLADSDSGKRTSCVFFGDQ